MILSHSKTILNRQPFLPADHPAERLVSVSVGQFEARDETRKTRRQHQSRAVRQLLDSALHSTYPNLSFDWQLEKKPSGKPYLSGTDSPAISLSHSANWVACAISSADKLGIDIETIKPRDWRSICKNFFHPEESTWILCGSEDEQNIRGLVCWCRKEALAKALGVGVTLTTEIAFSPDGVLLALPADLGARKGWMSHTDILTNQAVIATVWKN